VQTVIGVIVDFSLCADVDVICALSSLPDSKSRLQCANLVHIGLIHALEELTCVGRKRFDITTLTFGVDSVEGERRFSDPLTPVTTVSWLSGSRTKCLEVIYACAAHLYGFFRHN